MGDSEYVDAGESKVKQSAAYLKRREQVRRAQRTHRERKEAYIKSLENEIIQQRSKEARINQDNHNLHAEVFMLRKILEQHGITPDYSPHGHLAFQQSSRTAAPSPGSVDTASSDCHYESVNYIKHLRNDPVNGSRLLDNEASQAYENPTTALSAPSLGENSEEVETRMSFSFFTPPKVPRLPDESTASIYDPEMSETAAKNVDSTSIMESHFPQTWSSPYSSHTGYDNNKPALAPSTPSTSEIFQQPRQQQVPMILLSPGWPTPNVNVPGPWATSHGTSTGTHWHATSSQTRNSFNDQVSDYEASGNFAFINS